MVEEDTQDSMRPPAPLPGREDVSILVLSGPASGHFHRVPRSGGVIGRDPDVEIRIADPGISRRHVSIDRNETGHYEVHDLDSRYGLYVEGRRVKRHILEDGDRLQLSGETTVRIRYQDPKETEILERIREDLTRDPLTGVHNRRHFLERLEQEYAFARRHKAPIALLMIDVDHYKRINDEQGHHAGDEILRTIARSLQATIRTEDLLARYGGDEFVVLARGLLPDEARAFAERLGKGVREKGFKVGEVSYQLSLSIGIAWYGPTHVVTMMELVARADAALYQAKRQGRDRVELWVPADSATTDLNADSVES